MQNAYEAGAFSKIAIRISNNNNNNRSISIGFRGIANKF